MAFTIHDAVPAVPPLQLADRVGIAVLRGRAVQLEQHPLQPVGGRVTEPASRHDLG